METYSGEVVTKQGGVIEQTQHYAKYSPGRQPQNGSIPSEMISGLSIRAIHHWRGTSQVRGTIIPHAPCFPTGSVSTCFSLGVFFSTNTRSIIFIEGSEDRLHDRYFRH